MKSNKEKHSHTPPSILHLDEHRDLGFGSVVASESHQRLLNRDGSFNVERTGLSFWASFSLYHSLLEMSWPKFLSAMTLFYIASNALFALAFVACGEDALTGAEGEGRFLRAFFFSVHTFATIGYGNVSPVGFAANALVTLEALVGLFAAALLTGLIFARFARPTAKILFSRQAVVAPYQDRSAFMFRVSNGRRNQIIELAATVLMAKFETVEGRRLRRFYPLNLERKKVVFFPLTWTIVHPIDESSPLYGLTHEDLHAADAEFLVLFTGIDETFSQTVHTRSSYKAEEVVWNAKFSDIYTRSTDDQLLRVDIRRLHNVETIETAPGNASPQTLKV
ncbi:MAG TPA: ion channel [Pyrinomonadaceae bacterium]|jgi:inward rectifier potassium channel